MNRALLIIYEPALFLLAALAWAGWELWLVRTRKGGGEKATPETPPPDDPTGRSRADGS